MIGPNDLAQLFRVELAGKCGRIHQVAEHHSELAPFRLRGMWYEWRGRNLGRRVSRRHELWCR